MDQLHERLNALESQVHTLTQHTRTTQRRLHWWRGLACGAVVLAGLTWALPAVVAQEEEAKEKSPKGLAQRVAALEDLLKHFSREKHDIFITGANLHIVNGLGSTDCGEDAGEPIPDCPNGLGNLIVGYNEPRPPDAETIRTGSHNVVVGRQHNFSRFGGLVVGGFNEISGRFASVSGGSGNTASGDGSSVSGGQGNTASGVFPRPLGLPAPLEFIQQALEPFKLFLPLEENRHDNGLKRPWTRHHDASLHMQLGAIKEPVNDRVILFRQGTHERRPAAALIFNQLTEWR
jgi:hypothetical protein